MFTGISVNSKFCGCDYVVGQIYDLKGLTEYLGVRLRVLWCLCVSWSKSVC